MSQGAEPHSADTTGLRIGARALFARVSRRSMPLIVPMNERAACPRDAGPALFCIHSIVGVGVSDFLALARRMGGSVRVFGVQAPQHRVESEPGFGASVEALADIYAGAIAEAAPEGPLIVAGWSAGAAIALEVAHHLRDRGRHVALLAAIEGAPEIAGVGLRPWDPRYWIAVAGNLPAWLRAGRGMEQPLTILRRWARSLAGSARRLAARSRREVAPRLERLVSLDRYPPAQRRFMARLYDAIMTYDPRPWAGPLVVYEARAVLSLPQYLQRWRRVAPQAVRAPLEGNHVSIMSEPRVADLARDLELRIAVAVSDRA